MAPSGIVIRDAHYPGRAPVEAYGNGGFRFAGMSHRGDLLCLPSGIHGWTFPDLSIVDGWERILAEAADIEILLVGTGRDLVPLPAALRSRFRESSIRADSMSTGAAVRTFNVLLAEERSVAAALRAVD